MAMLLASALAGLGEGVLEGKQMRRQRDLQDEERAARKEDQAWEKENRDYTRTERAKAPLRDTYTRLSDPEYTSSMAPTDRDQQWNIYNASAVANKLPTIDKEQQNRRIQDHMMDTALKLQQIYSGRPDGGKIANAALSKKFHPDDLAEFNRVLHAPAGAATQTTKDLGSVAPTPAAGGSGFSNPDTAMLLGAPGKAPTEAPVPFTASSLAATTTPASTTDTLFANSGMRTKEQNSSIKRIVDLMAKGVIRDDPNGRSAVEKGIAIYRSAHPEDSTSPSEILEAGMTPSARNAAGKSAADLRDEYDKDEKSAQDREMSQDTWHRKYPKVAYPSPSPRAKLEMERMNQSIKQGAAGEKREQTRFNERNNPKPEMAMTELQVRNQIGKIAKEKDSLLREVHGIRYTKDSITGAERAKKSLSLDEETRLENIKNRLDELASDKKDLVATYPKATGGAKATTLSGDPWRTLADMLGNMPDGNQKRMLAVVVNKKTGNPKGIIAQLRKEGF